MLSTRALATKDWRNRFWRHWKGPMEPQLVDDFPLRLAVRIDVEMENRNLSFRQEKRAIASSRAGPWNLNTF